MNDFAKFVHLVRALEPALSEVVFVGGWAHRLHRRHPLARDPGYEPLVTLDADVVIPTPAPATAEDLGARLEAAGFVAAFLGEDRPPVTHYELVADSSGFYAEFLVPLIGREYQSLTPISGAYILLNRSLRDARPAVSHHPLSGGRAARSGRAGRA